jgi:hypothetical protein
MTKTRTRTTPAVIQTEFKQAALKLLDWLRRNTRDPEDALAVVMIVSALLERVNHGKLREAAERASEELAGTDAAGSPDAMLDSYRTTQQAICGSVVMRLLRETAN